MNFAFYENVFPTKTNHSYNFTFYENVFPTKTNLSYNYFQIVFLFVRQVD